MQVFVCNQVRNKIPHHPFVFPSQSKLTSDWPLSLSRSRSALLFQISITSINLQREMMRLKLVIQIRVKMMGNVLRVEV